ncbi:MAG TPA: metallophosphoesterase [Planctomycetes bacterium]|nr:metallophosphoesterase [Planctomycetota bacterium]
MRIAIISDIHANLPALEAVLADIDLVGVDRIYCLGDVIGYGPEPRECLEVSTRFDVNLLGNHEEAVLYDPIGFNPRAKAAVEWTKQQLMSTSCPREETAALWKHLASMKQTHEEGDIFLAHGTPRDPTREYLFVQDCSDDPEKVEELLDCFGPPTAFVGHTHVAGIFTPGPRFRSPEELGGKINLGSENTIVNVGSVGQPRDGDPRSSYVIVDQDELEFRRVVYPVDLFVDDQATSIIPTTIGAEFEVLSDPQPENLALRLIEGR